MKIDVIHYIKWQDIAEEFGWEENDVNFLVDAENHSYIEFRTDFHAIIDLEDSIEYAKTFNRLEAITRYQNELKLIKYLNSFGHSDKVLIFYAW